MKKIYSKSSLISMVVIILSFSPCQSQAVQRYTIINWGTPGVWIIPTDINNLGEVVGRYHPNGWSAFLWTKESGIVNLGGHSAYAINNLGQVVMGSGGHAFLWTHESGMVDFGNFEGGYFSAALDITDSGQVVGEGTFVNRERNAFFWTLDKSEVIDLGNLGADHSIAIAINDNRAIVGYSYTDLGDHRAFLWTEGEGMKMIGSLSDWGNDDAYDINNHGQVVGCSRVDTGYKHAFLWTEERGTVDLGTLGGETACARGINNHGQIVGTSRGPGGIPGLAFMWEYQTLIDLNKLIPPNSGWILGDATAINDVGEIVGNGYFNGQYNAYLLTPIPSVTVEIDIKPGSCTNKCNLGSRGSVPVTIFGNDDFDVANIDPTTIEFVGITPLRWAVDDNSKAVMDDSTCMELEPDGIDDLSLKFDALEIANRLGGFSDGDVVELKLTGALFDGTPFEGIDSILVLERGGGQSE